jgi:Ca2+:H+ antiporter
MDALFLDVEDGDVPNPEDGSLKGLLALSRGTSIILLLVYFAYLHFQVRGVSSAYRFPQSDTQ